MRRKILSILLAICIVISFIPVYSFAAGTTKSSANCLVLGIPKRDEKNAQKWTFPHIVMKNDNETPIKYVTIAFSCTPSSGDGLFCNQDSSGAFQITRADTGYLITITLQHGKTATNQQWTDFLEKNFYVILTNDSIEYTITIASYTSAPFEGTALEGNVEILYRQESNHYYAYINKAPNPISWSDAFTEAKTLKYYGRQGYLITITSADEAAYVAALVGHRNGWTAGTRISSYYPWYTMRESTKTRNSENLATIGMHTNAVATLVNASNAFFWADGADDEKGFIYYPSATYVAAYTNKFQYTNWNTNEDGWHQPDAHSGTEAYMHFQSGIYWNDFPDYTDGVTGYFVEFGGKSSDHIIGEGRTTVVISPAKVITPTITSQFTEEGDDYHVTTVNSKKVTPNEFTVYKKNGNNYQRLDELDGIGTYLLAAGYVDTNGNSYYSEKEDTLDALKLTVKLEGLNAKDTPAGYPIIVNDIEKGTNYIAQAPEIAGYTVDKAQKAVNNIRAPRVITFYYKQENCNIKVILEGLSAEDIPAGWTDGQTTTVKKGSSFTAAAPTVEGYLVDRYAVTLDPVTENKTIVFRYAKEGVGNKGRNVKVKLRDTDGKALSAEGYATSYVVEKGAGISLAAPEIPGYTFKEGSFSPKHEGYVLDGRTFTADSVTKNTTVTFTYEKQPEPPEPEMHTVTVTLAGLDADDCPENYPLEIQVPEGGSYTAVAPQIEGYTVDKTLETVKNIAADQVITFTYAKPPESLTQYEVNVELLERKSETVTEKIEPPKGFITKYYITQGGGFSLTPPTLDGYNYIGASDNTSVAPIKANQTVQFFYQKPVTHTVTIILKGASLTGYPKTVTVTDGEDYIAIAPLINGKKADKYSVPLTNITKDETIIFEYKNVKGPSTPKPPEEEPEKSPVGDVLNAEDHIRYMAGHASGLFGPEGDLTRAQCAQIFYNLLLDKDAVQRVSFPDVPETQWYARAIETLAGMDVLQGYNDGTFQPEKRITRAEFTAIAMRFGELDKSGENPFPDVTEDQWYYSDVVGSAKYGWIQGYTDGTFRPEEKISRTEVTYIVNRMLKRTADQGYIDANPEALASFPDLPSSYWGYYSIMEATNAHDHTWKDKAEVWTKIR